MYNNNFYLPYLIKNCSFDRKWSGGKKLKSLLDSNLRSTDQQSTHYLPSEFTQLKAIKFKRNTQVLLIFSYPCIHGRPKEYNAHLSNYFQLFSDKFPKKFWKGQDQTCPDFPFCYIPVTRNTKMHGLGVVISMVYKIFDHFWKGGLEIICYTPPPQQRFLL